ncbi:hypothetical protein QBC39DRAFT_352700 [Podospora conica]|nr:hypothetical protein QBC39DRAFT_352700 [Schizothecium conicum]
MVSKAERRQRKNAVRREHQAQAAEQSAAQNVGVEMASAPEAGSGGPKRGYPFEIVPDQMPLPGPFTEDEDMTSTDRVNMGEDHINAMKQVMAPASASAPANQMAISHHDHFDVEDAFEKLAIASKNPCKDNLAALESTFSHPDQMIEILLSENHPPMQAVLLIVALIGSVKKAMEDDNSEHREGLRLVHTGHFSHMKQLFRRMSVLEGKREALPTFAQDPDQPLPSPALLEELDGIQATLQELVEREHLTPYFNELRAQLADLRDEFNRFSTPARQQLKRQQMTMSRHGDQMAKQGAEMQEMREQLQKKDERLDEQDQMMEKLAAEMNEVKALLTGQSMV